MKIFIFVGRPLDPLKGLIELLNAAELLLKDKNERRFILWIVGGDPLETITVKRKILKSKSLALHLHNGHIMLWGRVDHESLPELYSRSTVLVMPSVRETFGIVSVEAMMCGCPVVGSNIPGISDTVMHMKTGILFNKGCSKELADIMKNIIDNEIDIEQMSKNAITHAQERYNQRKLIDKYENAYYAVFKSLNT